MNESYTTETIAMLDANGQPQVYRIDWTTVHASGPRSCAFNGSTTSDAISDDYKLVNAITLPNGKAYTFEYNTAGMLSKVTLPSGAYIRYQYAREAARDHVTARWVSADGTRASQRQTTYFYSYSQSGFGCPLIHDTR